MRNYFDSHNLSPCEFRNGPERGGSWPHVERPGIIGESERRSTRGQIRCPHAYGESERETGGEGPVFGSEVGRADLKLLVAWDR